LAKVTLVFAVLLIVLGLVGYFGTGAQHVTALIPAWFGVALGFGGLLAISPSESRRKLFMHINVTIGLVGFIGGAVEMTRSIIVLNRKLAAVQPDATSHSTVSFSSNFAIAMASKATMTGLLLIYVILCVRSFIAARRAREV